jgi:uncharacterized repeat protein (TIGR03803 family)
MKINRRQRLSSAALIVAFPMLGCCGGSQLDAVWGAVPNADMDVSAKAADIGPGLVAAIGSAKEPHAAPTATPAGITYKSLYAFKNPPDGVNPNSGLVEMNGELYGTSYAGGAKKNGAVFEISTSGAERVIYSFKGKPDGAEPVGLTVLNGKLYGTTAAGGTKDIGTVFELTASGAETALHSFTGGSTDGSLPTAPPTALGGVLYGTTISGGAYGNGTVFEVMSPGNERLLHSFGELHDGATPQGPLTALNGRLYGTTTDGGAYLFDYGGTVFEIETNGRERVLHSFGGPSDAASPTGTLCVINGALYGTTEQPDYRGTVFEVTTYGAERVLYRFGSYAGDGRLPQSGLTAVDGVLYGETDLGGFGVYPSGTIFSVRTTGLERVLYTFEASNSSQDPTNSLTDVNGVLYGTTYYGGRFGYDNGTVFKLSL